MLSPASSHSQPDDAPRAPRAPREGRVSARSPFPWRWARRWGVAPRLLLAVLLPITILAGFAGTLLSERHQTAQDASLIASRIPKLNGIVKLRSLLVQEQIPAEAELRARQLGVQIAEPARAFGITEESQSAARAAVDAQLRELGGTAPASFLTGLRTLRSEIDSGRIGATAADHAFTRLSESMGRVFTARLASLERETARMSQGAALNRSLATLSDASEALSAGSGQVGELSDVYFGAPPQRPRELGALDAQVTLFESVGARLRATAPAAIATVFARIVDAPSWRQFEAIATGAASRAAALGPLAGAPTGMGGLAGFVPVARLFDAGYRGVQQLYGLVSHAELEAHRTAARLQASSTAGFRNLLIGTLIAAVLAIGAALALARSISRPLKRLERHARAVSDGDPELAPLRPQGPKETVAVSETFNELVSNLRLLEGKTRALAECSLEDPVLAEPLPGRLGQALQRSVAVLSGSLVERDNLQQRLAHQATHDVLTGLHNRAAAVEFLGQALARAARNSEALAVLSVDLDGFKRANDTHGHAVGDAILREIARRMAEAARRGDFLARLGGDEFVVIAEGIDDGAEATAIAARLIEAASEPVEVSGVRSGVGARVGIAFALDGAADDPSQLLARADLAVSRAKHSPSSHVEIYDESMQRSLVVRGEIEQELERALDGDGSGLFLQYQPVIDTVSGELAAVEALVRWDRPGHGRTAPNDFIPVAEASDLIIRLDRWVLAAALAQFRLWERSGFGDISIAVNISGRHLLSGKLVEHVAEALAASGVQPRQLILELTETVLLSDLPTVSVEVERLRALGVRVSIDDFGTGYTSLAHLQHLTVDEIKIDRSFIQQLPGGRDSSLVRMVTELGHHLGVSIVAEGVETDAQLVALREVGCDSLQGFLIARPLPVEHLLAWERERTGEETSSSLDEAV
jgi:diguanylate cyclase (GGDEF)-like protein